MSHCARALRFREVVRGEPMNGVKPASLTIWSPWKLGAPTPLTKSARCGLADVQLDDRYFKQKDMVENTLRLRLRGDRDLAAAQEAIARDWTQFLDAAKEYCSHNKCAGGSKACLSLVCSWSRRGAERISPKICPQTHERVRIMLNYVCFQDTAK